MARFQTGAEHLAALRKWGRLAQLVEQLTLNQRVVGSNPSASTISFKYLEARQVDSLLSGAPMGHQIA
jgi:hypothetical protein